MQNQSNWQTNSAHGHGAALTSLLYWFLNWLVTCSQSPASTGKCDLARTELRCFPGQRAKGFFLQIKQWKGNFQKDPFGRADKFLLCKGNLGSFCDPQDSLVFGRQYHLSNAMYQQKIRSCHDYKTFYLQCLLVSKSRNATVRNLKYKLFGNSFPY